MQFDRWPEVLRTDSVLKDHFARSSRNLRKGPETSSRPLADQAWPEDDDRRIAPTQRLSDVCLVFDIL